MYSAILLWYDDRLGLRIEGELSENQVSLLREEDVDELSDKAVAKEGGLVHLADGSQETTLPIHPKGEQEILHILHMESNDMS